MGETSGSPVVLHKYSLSNYCGGVALAFAVLFAIRAAADPVAFSVQVQNELRKAQTEPVDQNGVAYVSLSAIVSQIKGACTADAEHAEIDLGGKTAFVRFNDARVSSSAKDFSLANPVLNQGTAVLIALRDVEPFFAQAFGLALRQDGVPPPAVSDTEMAQEDILTPLAEEPDMLEPVPAGPHPAVDRPINRIMIDPGHGGGDTGCKSTSGYKESALALAVATKLAARIQKDLSIKTILTRDNDRPLTHADRVSLANSEKGDLLISLHAGASFSAATHGVEIFVMDDRSAPPAPDSKGNNSFPGSAYTGRSLAIATVLADAIAKSTEAGNRGVRQVCCHVLKDVYMPGLLLEMGFLSNPTEGVLLQTETYQDMIVKAIVEGLAKQVAAPQPAAAKAASGKGATSP
ncbi:MAG TPA: N-acetylmuramoyl-L-alanine amidase [Phycisphaerae bacterium]|nr:N-acetylmuramoyl-L-alanine amidase [Phycisphaerae bacterium]